MPKWPNLVTLVVGDVKSVREGKVWLSIAELGQEQSRVVVMCPPTTTSIGPVRPYRLFMGSKPTWARTTSRVERLEYANEVEFL